MPNDGRRIRTYAPGATPRLSAGAPSSVARRAPAPPSEPAPNPGSFDATQAGCTCPPIANHFGRGAAETAAGSRVFEIAPDCPLHAGPG